MSNWNDLQKGDWISPTEFYPEVIESPYEIVQTLIEFDLCAKVCELLGLDPDKTNAITIDADGRLNGASVGCVLTVKRIKDVK